MQNPEETIADFRLFIKEIENQKYRVNFLLRAGYYNFIEDLESCAIQLKQVCEKILEDE